MISVRTHVVLAAVIAGACASARAADAAPSDALLFDRIATVLTHPRCLNCHTSIDRPKQGNDRHRHQMNVQRGSDNQGAVGMRCATCHQGANDGASGVPGAPNWHLAPLSMSWENKGSAALCRALLDRK